ncbi:MAG: KH domain-containing protein [Firmicutes bacterium]|uniref:KH domain-containing protein n=1 Tax=Candidatus Onthovivens merdipullorum TaxID=2840889 RepID=A0A9D9DH90_9BACL|nr:KH domain-containing protein [Candidatus Onthovivens merdipullorum]
MDYIKLIHTIIDPFVKDPSAIIITQVPQENENDLTFDIASNSENTAHLIGKKGCVATAVREIVSIAGKLEKKRIHLKFESFDEDEK